MTIFSDKSFSQKLERAEAVTSADFEETRARLFPASGAEWIEVGGAYAMFDGIASPLTQTFGLGVFDEIIDVELDEIEAFFKRHNAPVFHEVSPLADASLIGLLNERGYQPIELTSVMYRMLQAENAFGSPTNSRVLARIVSGDEIDIFAETSVAGSSAEMPEFADFGIELCKIGAVSKGASPFIAELDGKPIATGMLFVYEDVALLGGASTIPEWRRNGAQNALLEARLRFAAERGCRLATMGASPGSQSQRNAEKNGFRVAYTRTKWQLKK
ncbi:MAG: GNAT family N-acetyltransferase [Acidobacteriota bacterium]|nr:GNAT family N-acetyltransferase [Acidobacteriota bacterium]